MKTLAVLLALMLIPQVASAQWVRCADDPVYVSPDAVQGRIDWAQECGYIDHHTADFMRMRRMYLVFNKGGILGTCNDPDNPHIPVISPDIPSRDCLYHIPNFYPLALCLE